MTPHEIRILTVCTANVCRSPMAEVMMEAELRRVGCATSVRSAGTHIVPMLTETDPHAINACRSLGFPLESRPPRQLSNAVLETDGATLVLTMTQQHVSDVVAVDAGAWERTFTMLEFADLAQRFPRTSAEEFGAYVRRLTLGRPTHLVYRSDHNVDDPYGHGQAAVKRAGRHLARAAQAIANASAPT